MSNGGHRGAGERVLESRHVIGLFLGVMLLSGLFFTLGYVMGLHQSEAQASGDDGLVGKPEFRNFSKPETAAKRANKNTSAPAEAPAADNGAPASSEWEFYHAGEKNKADDRLKPNPSAPAAQPKSDQVLVKSPAAARSSGNSKPSTSPSTSWGGYTLQVAALTREPDALELAKQLQKKKFPAYVLSPHGDKYYRVQVGPYADMKAADGARKGLEGAGFKAIVKH